MTRQRALKLSVGALCLLGALSPLARAKENPSAVETKIALEESLERRIKSVIGQILGSDDVIVIVTADMYTAEERKNVQPAPRPKDADGAVLPGVPAPDNMDGRETAPMLTFAETRTL